MKKLKYILLPLVVLFGAWGAFSLRPQGPAVSSVSEYAGDNTLMMPSNIDDFAVEDQLEILQIYASRYARNVRGSEGTQVLVYASMAVALDAYRYRDTPIDDWPAYFTSEGRPLLKQAFANISPEEMVERATGLMSSYQQMRSFPTYNTRFNEQFGLSLTELSYAVEGGAIAKGASYLGFDLLARITSELTQNPGTYTLVITHPEFADFADVLETTAVVQTDLTVYFPPDVTESESVVSLDWVSTITPTNLLGLAVGGVLVIGLLLYARRRPAL